MEVKELVRLAKKSRITSNMQSYIFDASMIANGRFFCSMFCNVEVASRESIPGLLVKVSSALVMKSREWLVNARDKSRR